MKKITSILVSLVLTVACILPVNATSDDLRKVQSYWLSNPELTTVDMILTVEALGLDVENPDNHFNVTYDFQHPVDGNGDAVAYQNMNGGALSKIVMALAAIKQDPAKFALADGSTLDLIALLKSKIDENGKIYSVGGNLESSTMYAMFALAIVDENYDLTKLGTTLANAQLTDGSWGYDGAWGGPDMTGWAIGALSLCGTTYQASIDKGLGYLASKENNEGAYDSGWGGNSNTQASVLWGLMEYDAQGLNDGKYNKNGANPYDYLMKYLLADGSFGYAIGGSTNLYATVQSALAVGVYENGSLVENFKAQYKELLNPTTPVPETPAPNPTTPTPTITTPVQTTNAVKTGDEVLVVPMILVSVISGGLYLFMRKEA